MTTSDELMRLSKSSEYLVSQEFLHDPEAGPLRGPDLAEELSGHFSLRGFHRAVSDCMSRFEGDPPAGDGALAEAMHKSLSIPRMLGMDSGVWHYLSCVARPDYVWYRWGTNGGVSEERFLGSMKRNAFARLWWCAELMKEGEHSSLVSACFESQDLYEAVFGRAFSKYSPAAKVIVRRLRNHERRVVREVAKDFNLMLSTYVLEDMSEEQIERVLEERVGYWVSRIGS